MHAPTVTQTAIRDKLAAGLIDVVLWLRSDTRHCAETTGTAFITAQ